MWLFKRKVQEILSGNKQLKTAVEADETIVGGHRSGKEHRGGSLKSKSAVVVAREVLEDGRTGNINFKVTENFEADTLKYALVDMIESGASILTDKHKPYESLKDALPIKMVLSDKGSSLEELHKQIMLFKNWLRGILYKCSKELLQKYLDEYKFRFNLRNCRKKIFDVLISKIMQYEPQPYLTLKSTCE